MKYSRIFGVVVLAFVATSAVGDDLVFPVFDVEVGESVVVVPFNLEDENWEYGGYHLTVEWSTDRSMPWASTPFSIEAVWELRIGGCPVRLASPGPSIDGDDRDVPVTLTWSGNFPYMLDLSGGSSVSEIELLAWQTYPAYSAFWNNVELILTEADPCLPTPPVAVDLGTLGDGTTIVPDTLVADEVKWYKFRLNSEVIGARGDSFTIHTIGSELADETSMRRNDTELGLYDWAGFLIAEGDDFEVLDDRLAAMMAFGAGQADFIETLGDLSADSCDSRCYDVPDDSYYLAVAAYDTEFAFENFEVANTSGLSGDLQLSLTLGSPDADCDFNGVEDLIDLYGGGATDCNSNGVLDSCDIAGGESVDCQLNGIPDECERDTVVLTENFENGTPIDWFATGAWHVTNQCPRTNTDGSTQWAYFGNDAGCTCDPAYEIPGNLVSPLIALPESGQITLEYDSAYAGTYDVAGGERDEAWLCIMGADPEASEYECLATDVVSDYIDQPSWETRKLDLSSMAGREVRLCFSYIPYSESAASRFGWQIDSIRIWQESESDVDCNGNMVPDSCDIAQAVSLDCDGNGVPDECEEPLVLSLFDDSFPEYVIDPVKWSSEAFNAVSVPYFSAPRAMQLRPSEWLESAAIDLSDQPWAVVEFWYQTGPVIEYWDGVEWRHLLTRIGREHVWHHYRGALPAEGLHDDFKFRMSCPLGDGFSYVDDVLIGVPLADCDSNGVPDSCEITQFGAADCNGNRILDVCEIAAGAVVDFDGDGLIAECDPDVDGDGVANEDDLCAESPLSVPVNPNGGPMGDFDDSCALELDDYYFMEICLYLSGPEGDPGFADCQGFFDFNSDGDVDLQDFGAFQAGFGG